MKTELMNHKLAYFILLLGVFTFVFYFFAIWPNRVLQRLASGVFVAFYFLWGVSTHLKTRRLTRKILLEYLAVSLLIGTILFLVTE